MQTLLSILRLLTQVKPLPPNLVFKRPSLVASPVTVNLPANGIPSPRHQPSAIVGRQPSLCLVPSPTKYQTGMPMTALP